MFSPKNDVAANKWAWRDVNAMANSCGAEPVFVDADRCKYDIFTAVLGSIENTACTNGSV